MNKFLCIFAAVMAVCSASGLYSGAYNVPTKQVAALEYQLQPRATLRTIGAYGSPVYGSPVYGSPVYPSPVYGSPVSPIYGSSLYGSKAGYGLGDISLARTALRLPALGAGPIRDVGALASVPILPPVINPGTLGYDSYLPRVAKVANAAASTSWVHQAPVKSIPAITIQGPAIKAAGYGPVAY